MQLSLEKIIESARNRWDTQDMVHDYASEYGSGGYGETPSLILLGNWNERGRQHPRVFAQLESQGVELLWYDEWTCDSNTGKVWRTSPDCYSWENPTAYWDGELLTPDDDFETWLEYALDEGRALNSTQVHDLDRKLREAGFTRVPEDGDAFESGWHPGQTDDPKVVKAEILAEFGPDTQIVFALVENSQFYTRWACYHRQPESEDE